MSYYARLTGGEDGPERGSLGDALKQVERRLSALERHRRGAISSDGTDTFLRSGNFIVTGGDIRVLDNGDIVIDGGELRAVSGATTRTLLDRDRLRLNRADGTRQVEITPAGGLRVYAANGTTLLTTIDGDKVQVGSDVVMDSAGLKIGGVLQTGMPHIDAAFDFAQNLQVDSTIRVGASISFALPAWVDKVLVSATHAMTNVPDTTGGTSLLVSSVRIDGTTGGGTSQHMVGHSGVTTRNAVTATFGRVITNPGSPIVIEARYQDTVSSGASSSGGASRLSAVLIGVRN